jgi:glycolate oxidase iron-sulfur subunit
VNPAQLHQEADRCVKCGLCLPHCPTYRLTLDEAESPRGRIALIQALADGALEAGPRLRQHLDACLECQACETVCPSEVRYAPLMDAARAITRRTLPTWERWAWHIALAGLSHRPLLRGVAAGLRQLQEVPRLRRRLFAMLGQRGMRLLELLPEFFPAPSGAGRYPSVGSALGEVALFSGCVSAIADTQAIDAAVRVLQHLGYRVAIPGAQVCCGAMHLHNGFPEMAARLAARNARVFADPAWSAVVTIASGCANTLRDGARLASPGDSAAALALGRRVRDVSEFLDASPWPESARLRPLAARIRVHDPCTLRHGLKRQGAVYRLLGRVPGLSVEPLADNAFCCGAAGTYLLTQPELAKRLLARKLEALRAAQPDLLVTSNTGCALHLRAGVRAAGLGVEVLHPVQLIARQLLT